MTHLQKQDCRDSGFTLVELAIVMIIIGLLIGGILKGQELITNAQVAATVAQLKGVDAAVSTFRDSYNAMPGDIANPTVRLANCAAAPCNIAGNSNGRLEAAPNAAAAAGENLNFWAHLNAADLITGVDGTADIAAWGQALPSSPAGGGLWVGFTNGAAALGVNATPRGGHYISLRAAPGAPAANLGALQASEAARMDRKIDDGSSNTGVMFINTAGQCSDGAGEYDEATNGTGCNMYFRIQG